MFLCVCGPQWPEAIFSKVVNQKKQVTSFTPTNIWKRKNSRQTMSMIFF